MNYSRKTLPFLLLTLLTLLIMIPAAVFGEDVDVQEIAVTNTPVKGKILLEKQGLVLTGFEETDDGLGNTVHTPIYEDGWLEGAVFEVRAVEDSVGKEGTKWFSANEVAATITTSGNETDETPILPLGHYYVTEVSAPAGYKFESTRYDVVLDSVDRYTPVVEIKVTAKNDFIPAQISLKKEKEIVVTSKNGDKTYEEAARLAAHYSKAGGHFAQSAGEGAIEIDYIQKKHVKKSPGQPAGFVIYHTNYSMLIDGNIDGIERVE